MGHAGAVISGGQGTAEQKFAAFEEVGAIVTRNPSEMGLAIREAFKKR